MTDDDQHKEALKQTGFWGRHGAGCIPVAQDTGRYLIPLRSGEVEQPFTWGTIGGAVDANEDPLNAAIREFKEETGYSGNILRTKHIHKYQKDDFTYNTFIVVVPEEFTPSLNWESRDAQWFDHGDWPYPLHFGLEEIINQGKI